MSAAPAFAADVLAALALDANAAATWTSIGASSLNATWRLDAGGSACFVKVNTAPRVAMLRAEAAGLRALATTRTVRVPAPLAVGIAGDHAFLALEWLDLAHGGRDAGLGTALAALHRHTSARFGFESDNTIGTTPQINTWSDDWATFFRDRRLAPQLAMAARRRGSDDPLIGEGERLLERVPRLLDGHSPQASLLHGDLWSGNAAATRSREPVVFDPAAYYGDREADLAMTELFGGFDASFYEAYRGAWPVDDGYERRRTLYNLYHVLNHDNLFGGSYAGQARRMIALLSKT